MKNKDMLVLISLFVMLILLTFVTPTQPPYAFLFEMFFAVAIFYLIIKYIAVPILDKENRKNLKNWLVSCHISVKILIAVCAISITYEALTGNYLIIPSMFYIAMLLLCTYYFDKK